MTNEDLKGQVRKRYAEVALAVWGTSEGDEASCCGPSCCGTDSRVSKGAEASCWTHLAAALTRRRRR